MKGLPAVVFPWRPAAAGHDVVVVDVEGNGQQPPEIVEIAVLPISSERPVEPAELRTWLVRPVRPISGLVTRKVHGISNADVAAAPSWDEVAGEIAALLAGRVLVAHNAAVERRLLGAHLPAWQPAVVLDTMRLAKMVWPDLPGGYGLDNLIDHAALTSPEPAPHTATGSTGSGAGRRHRAGYDAWMTAALLQALLAEPVLHGDQVLTTARLPDPHHPRRDDHATDPADPAVDDQQEGLW